MEEREVQLFLFSAMPEFEDNSILGDSIYQHINFEGREAGHGPVDMKMFEQDDSLHSDENGKL